MTHYRVPFFEQLRKELSASDIRLRVLYGQGTPTERTKDDSGELSWGEKLSTHYLANELICWQPFMHTAGPVDMLVVGQENKLVCNLIPQFFNKRVRFGLWGHGGNLQGNPASFREKFKRLVSKHADWWFAYTEMSLPLIQQSGFPIERITVLNNAVDTNELRAFRAEIRNDRLATLRAQLDIRGTRVGVYVGSLYEDKRIDFLLQAVERIKGHLPEFEFLVIGAGPLATVVEAFCAEHPWSKYVGPQHAAAKVETMALAHAMLNPGLVGLGILDSFACEVPMVTTDCRIHSPEIAYLEHGVNGLMTPNSLERYVEATSRL
jgi:glycosyltransferase involved in cell wall biosynthesis